MVDCRDVVQSSDEWWPFSQLFLPSKRKSWIPGIRLLSRLCLETRSSEFFARGRCSSSRVCFSRPPPPLHLFPFSSLFLPPTEKTKLPPKTVYLRCFLTTFRRHCTEKGRWNLGEIFSLRDHDVPLMYRTLPMYRYD